MKREVPFSIGFAIIIIAAFFASEFVISYPPVREANAYRKAQLAEAAQSVIPLAIPSSASSSSLAATPAPATTITITPDLLPVITLATQKTKKVAATPLKLKVITPAATTQSTSPAAATAPSTSSFPATAQAFLADTTAAAQPYGNFYKAVFTTGANTKTPIVWSLDAVTLGGTTAAPQYNVAFSCDPPPNMPLPGAANQMPTLAVRTAYSCTVTLTPLTGNDRRIQSRTFSLTTGAGPFTVTAPAALATVLRNGENDGGFVFNNADTKPVTVTGLTLDIRYTALNTQAGPTVFQILDPIVGTPLVEQHLEDLPVDPAVAYTHAQSGIVIPLSLIIKPATQKLLPLRIMGTSVMGIPNATPTIMIALRNVTTDKNSAIIKTNNLNLSWSCIVPPTGYDPNATSGPYATGEACR